MLPLLERARQHALVLFLCLFCGSLSASTFTVMAIADESRGANGGQLVRAGSSYIEFIGGAGYEFMMFAVTDLKKRPLLLSDVFAVAVVRQNEQQYRIQLQPDGDNFLSARASPRLQRNASIVFIAELANGAQLEARFTSR